MQLAEQVQGVFALNGPNALFIIRDDDPNDDDDYKLLDQPLRDFAGIEDPDKLTIEAIMNFGYNLEIGNMDEAYKSVKSIQNPVIWENMA